MPTYTVNIYTDTMRGRWQCEAKNAEEAATRSLYHDNEEIEWERLDEDDTNNVRSVEIYAHPDQTGYPVHEWCPPSERFARSERYLLKFLPELQRLLNSQPRFTEGELDSYEAAARIGHFMAYFDGIGPFSEILPK